MINSFKELYHDQIKDLYSAETQLVETLPEMVNQASDSDLKKAFQDHLEETREHQNRLRTICSKHGISPEGEECDAMRGLIKEAKKHAAEISAGPLRDAVLIAAANRVEHYEIAGYGVAKEFAKALDLDDDADLLDKTLDEESAADDKITKIATGGVFSNGVNADAMG